MKKKLLFLTMVIILALTVSALSTIATADTVRLTIQSELYIGHYESAIDSGTANIIFGAVSEDEDSYGVVIEDSNGEKKVFKAKSKGAEGKFGVAIYNMEQGEYYIAYVYAGDYTNVTKGVGFYGNECNEVVVNVNWGGATGSSTTKLVAKEGSTISYLDAESPSIIAPANSEFGGWYTKSGTKFDFSDPLYQDVNIEARWTADDTYKNVQFSYVKDGEKTFRTNIGASAPVDLSDGSSVVMEMDVLSNLTDTNFQIEIDALAWLPSKRDGTNYNNNFTSTGYIGFAGNPAYTETSSNHYGYVAGIFPTTADKTHMVYGTEPNEPSKIFTAGSTVRIVYTAPTATKTGSFVYYTKPTLAGEDAFVERASMRGIRLTDVFNTDSVYMWLSFVNGMTWAKPSMNFTNFRVYKGDHDLPIMLWNHADTEISISERYATDTEKSYTLTVNETNSTSSRSGYIMTKNPSNLSQGGYVALEMDVLATNLGNHNVNYGPSIWQYLGLTNNNTYAGSFHDNLWYGNPMYRDASDGHSSWKTDDVVDKTTPTISKFCVEDIWKVGQSVKMIYNAPTATKDGSIIIYTKLIKEDDTKWVEVASVKDIKVGMVLDTSKVYFGFCILKTQKQDFSSYLTVSNLRAYNALGDIEVVAENEMIMTEDVDYVPDCYVSFDINGATGKMDDVIVKKGSLLAKPDMTGVAAPSGYEFDCWLDENGKIFDFSQPITKHITLKARWIEDWSSAYNVSGNMITGLTSYGKTLTDIIVPATINGVEIKSIGYGAFQGSNIESVTIGRNITTIYDDAFRGIESLDVVTFDEGSKLTTVGDSVFRGCTALSNITLPETVTSVGELTFFGAKESGYDELYSLNPAQRGYYSEKYTFEFLGDDVMPIGGYIEPSVGYFADGVTIEQVMKDFVDSGCNLMIGIGQLRYGTTSAHYAEMLKYLEKYGGMMLIRSGGGSYANMYASYAGNHSDDEPGVISWVPGLGGYYSETNYIEANMPAKRSEWKEKYSRKLFFVNLLQNGTYDEALVYGAHIANNLNLRNFNKELTWAEYAQYADIDYYYKTYIDYVNPEVFSYDYYPIRGEYPNLTNGHFKQLYYANYYSQVYNKQVYGKTVPFWNFIQIHDWGNNIRAANYNEIAWQVNTALAFGSKGYQYYCYNDYGDISGEGKPSGWTDTPINIDGTKNEVVYNNMQRVNVQSQSFAKWLLNADVDHLAVHGAMPNAETVEQFLLTPRDKSLTWRLSSTSGVNHIVSYMNYYANNNEYAYGEGGDTRELYFVCNNSIQGTNNGRITLNFNKTVSGSYIYNGIEYTFRSSSITVNTNAGEGFAVLLDN